MLWKDQIREWRDEAREDGLAEGREEGIAEGKAIGLAEGLLEGERKKAIETARQLLKMNLGTVDQIATATQLSVKEVLEIKQEI
ncbi:MAG: hypothetical protein UIB61_03580 [Treponema sp.]|nr:hypothetical protein [Treponema sp.]